MKVALCDLRRLGLMRSCCFWPRPSWNPAWPWQEASPVRLTGGLRRTEAAQPTASTNCQT